MMANAAKLLGFLSRGKVLDQQLAMLKQSRRPGASHTLPLHIPMMQLANEDPELASDLCMQPEVYRAAVARLLLEQGALPDGCRVWLRMDTAFVQHESLEAMHQSTVCWGGHCSTMSGIVHCVTTPVQCVYSRTLICPACQERHQALAEHDTAITCMCGAEGGVRDWPEDLAGRVLMPVQRAWLSELLPPLASASGHGPYRPQQCIEVVLRDDLCGHTALRVGGTCCGGGLDTADGSAWGRPQWSGERLPHSPRHQRSTSRRLRPLAVPNLGPPWTRLPAAGWQRAGYGGWAAAAHGAAHPGLVALPLLPLAAGWARSRRPLQALANTLLDAVGTYLGPNLCLALLTSAAMAPCAMRALQASGVTRGPAGSAHNAPATPRIQCPPTPGPFTPGPATVSGLITSGQPGGLAASATSCTGLSLVALHEPNDLTASRALRAAAMLLCPIQAAPVGPGLMGDLLLPKLDKMRSMTDSSTAEESLLTRGSHLTGVNGGVMVLDASVLFATGISGGKARAQALTTVMSGAGNVRLGTAHNTAATEIVVPTTATLWCAAPAAPATIGSGPAASTRGGGGGGRGGRGGGCGGGGGGGGGAGGGVCVGLEAAFPWERFGLAVLVQCQDDETAALCVLEAGCDVAGERERGEVGEQRRALQHHMAVVSRMGDRPTLTPAAQAMLAAYYVAVRSSGQAAGIRSKDMLRALVACAGGCARLLLRTQVVPSPDCTVAILLMEETLALRHKCDPTLDLGPRLSLNQHLSLDDQLRQVHTRLAAQLQAYSNEPCFRAADDEVDMVVPVPKGRSGHHEP